MLWKLLRKTMKQSSSWTTPSQKLRSFLSVHFSQASRTNTPRINLLLHLHMSNAKLLIRLLVSCLKTNHPTRSDQVVALHLELLLDKTSNRLSISMLIHSATWRNRLLTNQPTSRLRWESMDRTIRWAFAWLINTLKGLVWTTMLKTAITVWWVNKALLQLIHSKTTSATSNIVLHILGHLLMRQRWRHQRETISVMSRSRNTLSIWLAMPHSAWVREINNKRLNSRIMRKIRPIQVLWVLITVHPNKKINEIS